MFERKFIAKCFRDRKMTGTWNRFFKLNKRQKTKKRRKQVGHIRHLKGETKQVSESTGEYLDDHDY